MEGKTLVLGASKEEHRYSFIATKRLLKNGIDVLLVGKRKGEVDGNVISREWPKNENIHTITMYLAAKNQVMFYDDILNSGAQRIIFNPGAENSELAQLAKEKGIYVEEACTLVMLSTNQYN